MAREISFREAIQEAIAEEMSVDPTVVVIGEDVGAAGGVFKVTEGLQKRFGPLRVRDTPIAESAIMGAAMGAAITGLRPIAEIMFADFLAVCFDMLVNQIAKFTYLCAGETGVPVVIRSACGAGLRFGPHHSQNVENWLLNVPGLKIVAPSNPQDAKGLLKSAIRDPNPVVFLEHKALYTLKGPVTDSALEPLGRARIVREGSDITIVATMRMVREAVGAADLLHKHGVSAEIIDLRTVAPWDRETLLTSVRKTHRLITVEENPPAGGWGSEIVSTLATEAFDALDAPPARVTMPPAPIPFSPPLEDAAAPHAESVVAAAVKLIEA